jgi:hypothetical protein
MAALNPMNIKPIDNNMNVIIKRRTSTEMNEPIKFPLASNILFVAFLMGSQK